MKPTILQLIAAGMFCLLAAAPLQGADLKTRQPTLDANGRFWLYRNGPAHPPLPFSPYGWMSDITNMDNLVKIDLECTDHPNQTGSDQSSSETQSCIQMKINWGDATWAGIAFISGPDRPPWWGENNRGRHYDLSNLVKKKLVFYARGDRGGESLKVQIGLLGDKPYGDSLHQPISGDDITLTPEWTRYEVDLNDVAPAELAHICNGFGVNLERANQPGSGDQTVIYLDDIYFE
jgi:hypothetical protein